MLLDTHRNYNEVQPAPCICEVFLETIRRHLDNHLTNKNNGEHFIHVFQS